MPGGTTWGGQSRVHTKKEPGPVALALIRVSEWNALGS